MRKVEILLRRRGIAQCLTAAAKRELVMMDSDGRMADADGILQNAANCRRGTRII